MSASALTVPPELPADWQALLRLRLLHAPDHEMERRRFGGLSADQPETVLQRIRAAMPAQLQPAAVLVPIVDRPAGPTLLLTLRASHLRRHAGQISFPGGRLEHHDADIASAALRETEEEIGIQAAFIEILGFLSDHVVMTGFRITPVVALLQPGFTLQVHEPEVAEVFEMPLAHALGRVNYRSRLRRLAEIDLETAELPYLSRNIWGATAGILAHLRDVIVPENAERGLA